MKLKDAPDKYEIQVGDTIKADHGWMVNSFKVKRVSAKYAFVAYNDVAEGKFPRIYDHWAFSPLPRQRFRTTNYTVLIEDK